MPIEGIQNFGSSQYKTAASSSLSGMEMSDFLNLIAAQLKNQDMMNPMKDTEFISQLAQFTSLQATQQLLELSSTSYALSMIGKNVTAASIGSSGEIVDTKGIVDGVSLYEGEAMVYIGDKKFTMQQIMSVGQLPNPNKSAGNTASDAEGADIADSADFIDSALG